MIPILRVNPLFGRDGKPPQAIRHLAFPTSLAGFVHTAEDPALFVRRRLRGGISWHDRGGTGLPGEFRPSIFKKIGSRLFLGGRMIDGGNPARAVLFTAEDVADPIWEMKETGIEGPKGTGDAFRQIVGIESNGTYLVVLSSFGDRAVSLDGGETFTGHGSIGFMGPSDGLGFVNGLAASAWGFVAVAIDGQLRTAPDPRGTWTARTSQFGTDDISGVVAGVSNFIAFGAEGKISTSALTNPSSWAARSSGTTTILQMGFCTGARTFLAGSGGTWRASTNDTTWTAPTDSPFKGESSIARSFYAADGEIFVHWGDGRLSRSSDEANWEEIEDPGLSDDSFFASGYLGA